MVVDGAQDLSIHPPKIRVLYGPLLYWLRRWTWGEAGGRERCGCTRKPRQGYGWIPAPGPAPAPSSRAAGRARLRQEDQQERMGERQAPTSAFLPDLFLFVSSCCSEQAAESEQQEQEILCLEGEIRVLFLLSKSNLFCFAGDFSAARRLGSMLGGHPAHRLLVFLTPSR